MDGKRREVRGPISLPQTEKEKEREREERERERERDRERDGLREREEMRKTIVLSTKGPGLSARPNQSFMFPYR